MITAAENKRRQSGQSMVEFAFLVPIILSMLTVLIQVEGAISTAIVNQKYSRQHLHYLMFNSRQFPETQFLSKDDGFVMKRYWIGVSDELTGDGPSGSKVKSVAPIRPIGRLKGDDATKGDVDLRKDVRVKVLTFICVPPLGGQIGQYYNAGSIDETTFVAGHYRFCED